ncbi:PulJ/GspJ family protein [Diaminobutyricibacter sp. McL0608]|uniref:PulJ/GspJ family protein n=1 Tax=Leifsonia sp. McL0608 TaxID=3143537 RepID=UPI0031F2E4F6
MKDDRGLSLIELIVAMFLTSIVLVVTVSLFVSTTKSANVAQSIDGGTRQASNGMNELARMIRAATPNPYSNPAPGTPLNEPALTSASANSVTFYAYVNLTASGESPVKVTYTVNAQGRLAETQCKATTTTAGVNGHWDFVTGTACVTRYLCNSLPTTGQLFHYLTAGGVEISPPGTDATLLPTIRAIKVSLTIQPTGKANAVTLTNTVGMPNLGFVTTGTGS